MNTISDHRSEGAAGTDPTASVDAWLGQIGGRGEIGRLLGPTPAEQVDRGYGHTLREICQQPATWRDTASMLAKAPGALESSLADVGIQRREGSLMLTGSGSSLYAAECLVFPLQEALRVPVCAAPAGLLLTHPRGALPPSGPFLLVSLARSGNSPESRAVVDLVLENAPRAHHLVITCNRNGALATAYRSVPAVRAVVLDERTDDRSLVMTSSFTNLVLAGHALGEMGHLDAYVARSAELARAAASVLMQSADALAGVARRDFGSAVFLGSGCCLGAAREAALKMLEMTDGRVSTLPESFLGLRHGPMSALHDDTLIVAFLSRAPVARAYELDLLRELHRKQLGARRIVVGSEVPKEAAPGPDDVIVDCDAGNALTDADLVLVDVLVGQLLAFFRCLHVGLRPDAPSADGVISRVVDTFEIHAGPGGCRP
jgi:tagatose-6-phosphate ketose/aldose isomerase